MDESIGEKSRFHSLTPTEHLALARFTNSREGLFSHGFTLQAVKEWRTREHEAGRPSGLDDFFLAHNLCAECRANGKFAIGVRWRDRDGIDRAEEGPVAILVQQHELDNPVKWLPTRANGITSMSHAESVAALLNGVSRINRS